ncbi:MAG TPA: hypothetical protein VLU25_17240 [Acidobacteriota bacterium]|nr:hypothetical protein [Acidobacteriota bacterium]
MRGKSKTAAIAALALSYLLGLGLISQHVSICGCGGTFHSLASGLESVQQVAGGWNSWLGNSWALGASSWSSPLLSAAAATSSRDEQTSSPTFDEWRLNDGFSIEPLANIELERMEEARLREKLDCLRTVKKVNLVFLEELKDVRVRADIELERALEYGSHVVVVTAELPRLETYQGPLAALPANPGCPGAVKILQRRSAT